MSYEQAFLDAIIANPEDDTPRLVYSDWLEEQGGQSNSARAEYIRGEIALARADANVRRSLELAASRKRNGELQRKYSEEWFGVFIDEQGLVHGHGPSVRFHRGFPCELASDVHRILETGEKLFRLAPITTLAVRDLGDDPLSRLLQQPWVTRLRQLRLASYSFPDTDWSPLADCPYLLELRELILTHGILPPAGAARIAAANPCPKLKQLSFMRVALSDETLGPLFAGPAFAGLAELSFRFTAISPLGLEAVAAAPALARLRSLALPQRPIAGMGRIFTRAIFWPGLHHLEVPGCSLGDEGVLDLASAGASTLQTLKLDGNSITAAGIESLADSPLLEGLTSLHLRDNPIRDAGVIALANSPKAKQLRKLDLCQCGFGPEGAKALAQSPHLAGLRELSIAGNRFGIKGAKALADSPYLGELTRLSIGAPSVTAREHLRARFGEGVVSF